ncbi:MAG: alpha/beta fold hydrolase [Candidatus Limnocylindria bacterium]
MRARWTELDLELPDGRMLHAYDTDPDHAGFAVVWHHGTPNIGLPPEPLFDTSERLGIRWISYDRPGYGGSTRLLGRDLAGAAGDDAAVANALGIDRFAVMGHSGGGSHALAVAALLPDRVVGAVSVSGLAPFGADGRDWFAGMADAGVAALRAALAGREEKERYEATAPEGDPGFIAADHEALAGVWGWLGNVVAPALAGGTDGVVDDDLAYVAPWTFDPAQIAVPTLVVHGGRDRIVPAAHAAWLARRIPGAELWLRPDDGHISALHAAPSALEWLATQLS